MHGVALSLKSMYACITGKGKTPQAEILGVKMFKGYRIRYNSLAHQAQNNMFALIALTNTLFAIAMAPVTSLMFHGVAIGGGYDRALESVAIIVISGILLNMLASKAIHKA